MPPWYVIAVEITGPKDGSDHSVVPWILGLMAAALAGLWFWASRRLEAGEKRCQEANAKLELKHEAAQAAILSLHQGVIADTQKTQAECTRVIERNSDALHQIKEVIRQTSGTDRINRKP